METCEIRGVSNKKNILTWFEREWNYQNVHDEEKTTVERNKKGEKKKTVLKRHLGTRSESRVHL